MLTHSCQQIHFHAAVVFGVNLEGKASKIREKKKVKKDPYGKFPLKNIDVLTYSVCFITSIFLFSGEGFKITFFFEFGPEKAI